MSRIKRQNTWYTIQAFFLSLMGMEIFMTSPARDNAIKDLENRFWNVNRTFIVVNYFHWSDKYGYTRRYELWLKPK